MFMHWFQELSLCYSLQPIYKGGPNNKTRDMVKDLNCLWVCLKKQIGLLL